MPTQMLNMKFHDTRYFIFQITFKQIHFYGHEDAEPPFIHPQKQREKTFIFETPRNKYQEA